MVMEEEGKHRACADVILILFAIKCNIGYILFILVFINSSLYAIFILIISIKGNIFANHNEHSLFRLLEDIKYHCGRDNPQSKKAL